MGFICYLPANLLPMLLTRTLGHAQGNTIVGGVIELFHHGAWDVAIIVFAASVVIPVTKFVVILYLVYSIRYHVTLPIHLRIHLYEAVEFIGRWSMIDVFVVAILTALVQLGFIVSINPGPAAIFFALSVAFTMLSAQALDPRLIWDSAERETAAACLRPSRRLRARAGDRRPERRDLAASRSSGSSRSLALLLALGVAWRTYSERGPLIEIVFQNAAGVEAGQTAVRFRDVKVGIGREDRALRRPARTSSSPPASTSRWRTSSTTTPSSGWSAPASPPRASPASRPCSPASTSRPSGTTRSARRSTASRACRARRSPPPTSPASASACARPTAAR